MAKNFCRLVLYHFDYLSYQKVLILSAIFGLVYSHTRGITESNISSNSSMAIIPYNPPQTLLKFHEATRNFTFAGKTLTIAQDWDNGGVAGVVWDAAVVLCKYIEKHHHFVAEKSIIELGAGTGLVGMVTALLGGEVTVTDRKMALKYINTNIDGNAEVLSGSALKVAELTWGQDVVRLKPPVDVILGADVIYIEDTFHDLLQTLLDLSGNQTRVLLSCRIRYKRDNRFLNLLKTKFDVTKVLYDKETDIVVYEAKRSSSTKIRDDL